MGLPQKAFKILFAREINIKSVHMHLKQLTVGYAVMKKALGWDWGC